MFSLFRNVSKFARQNVRFIQQFAITGNLGKTYTFYKTKPEEFQRFLNENQIENQFTEFEFNECDNFEEILKILLTKENILREINGLYFENCRENKNDGSLLMKILLQTQNLLSLGAMGSVFHFNEQDFLGISNTKNNLLRVIQTDSININLLNEILCRNKSELKIFEFKNSKHYIHHRNSFAGDIENEILKLFKNLDRLKHNMKVFNISETIFKDKVEDVYLKFFQYSFFEMIRINDNFGNLEKFLSNLLPFARCLKCLMFGKFEESEENFLAIFYFITRNQNIKCINFDNVNKEFLNNLIHRFPYITFNDSKKNHEIFNDIQNNAFCEFKCKNE